MTIKKTALAVTIIVICLLFLYRLVGTQKPMAQQAPSATPDQTVYTVENKRKYPQDYSIVLVGDSMTQYLGNCDELRSYLGEYLPNKSIQFLNYGFGSTNILSLQKRLTETVFFTRDFQAINTIDFDVLLLESFGHNPLSDFPLEEGLKKQNESLDAALALLKQTNPRGKIVFVATLAPNSQKYAQGIVDLTREQREAWVKERHAYIQNHIKYAKEHSIPLINIYEKSFKNGDGNLEYVSDSDYLHPSSKGIYFISQEIARFLVEEKILN